ncbi:MAG: hypothetical protein DMG73_13635 [Acidobacteria bacterium]|nr:MAG: hypothetical protein DMG73_13635 [Acidobacteriota bacterium]PYX65193.1 MAG: hypothetical protein DMG74_09540 [Acidobacteriota bacterium]
MKRFLGIFAVLVGLTTLPAVAQSYSVRTLNVAWQQDAYGQYPSGAYGQPGRLSPDDQSEFDKYYSKWLDARRKGDREDVEENARHMQEIMARYNIRSDVQFDQIASNGSLSPYAGNAGYGAPARLSRDDQKKFDKYYSEWVEANRKNKREESDENARKMQEIMARYNIPSSVQFEQIASNASGAYGGNGAYGYSAPASYTRLSTDDQKKFDKHYAKWLEARRKNDREDIDENARKMQDIMARYNIPANVPFDRIASAAYLNHH